MRANIARSRLVFFLIHWVLVLAGLALLGIGWYLKYIPVPEAQRTFLLDIHVSLGFAGAILIFIQLFLLILFKPLASYPYKAAQSWRTRAEKTVYLVVYLTLAVLIASGYLEQVYSAAPAGFWGAPLPVWGTPDLAFAELSGAAHEFAAFAFAGLVLIQAFLAGLGLFKRPERASPPPPVATEEEPEPAISVPDLVAAATLAPSLSELDRREAETRERVLAETRAFIAQRSVQSLAANLRLFGWIKFWVQFVLALVVALLLTFATSGHVFSPGKTGFGNAIYLAWYGFLLLAITLALAFYYTRAARKVVSRSEIYLSPDNRMAFWFLWAGLLAGGLGVLISFAGVALSIALLIVKAISHPPGIAITDPHNMIRALDVFVLILNFMLLIGHFVGTVTTLWLGVCASKARLDYLALPKLPA